MEPLGQAADGGREHLVPLYSRDQIQARVRALARAIRRDYEGRDLVVVGVLKGAFVFMADLIRALRLPLVLDFVGLSSYGSRSRSSGSVTISKPLSLPAQGRDVLVVEDILDTGLTMRVLLDYLWAQSPKSVRICALIDKRERRTEAIPADYVGFQLPEGFVVGYGIDYAERYRALPEIYRVEFGDSPGRDGCEPPGARAP
ncbi:MAG: hypoxanthine phosphoribosyltransferase [Deltaproteobacteria bacterium]|nr:hypoxanthine phosphoribosyltransferase [Deltaproteobacteria bacterium]MBI3077930.1 hypoxanthine phosphoribosyltransferase [Deltaproteobacteria bacterium]